MIQLYSLSVKLQVRVWSHHDDEGPLPAGVLSSSASNIKLIFLTIRWLLFQLGFCHSLPRALFIIFCFRGVSSLFHFFSGLPGNWNCWEWCLCLFVSLTAEHYLRLSFRFPWKDTWIVKVNKQLVSFSLPIILSCSQQLSLSQIIIKNVNDSFLKKMRTTQLEASEWHICFSHGNKQQINYKVI